jgi:hypothetical protein
VLVSSRRVTSTGSAVTVKLVLLVAVPPGVVTPIGPVVAPLGTVAAIAVADVTAKLALTPLKVTAVAPLKFVPSIVTLAPAAPLVGEKLIIVGALGVIVKLLALVAVPSGVVTLMGPVVAPLGTVAVIDVAEFTVKLALVPLNATAVAPAKFMPVIVTLVPTGPPVGEKLVIVGAGAVNVTELSVLVEAVLPLPAPSLATLAGIVAMTVPLVVMPLTAIV